MTNRVCVDREDWPVHQPAAPEAPIPGRHWYSACSDDYARVNPVTGVCEECGRRGCPVCGREGCDDARCVSARSGSRRRAGFYADWSFWVLVGPPILIALVVAR